jgi:hypothetical protein
MELEGACVCNVNHPFSISFWIMIRSVVRERDYDRKIERKRRTLGHLGALDPNLGAVQCKCGGAVRLDLQNHL